MPADPNRVATLFAAVVAMPAEERAAYLGQACGNDAELRRRVEALLQAHDNAGSFLERPAAAAGVTTDLPAGQWIGRDAPPVLSEGPGTRIGPYKLLQKIGEGGMGVVYMAEQQEPLRRMVALKIIKPGMDSAAVVARFEAERQALALMDHQNIARVFDGGTTDSGRPFFVMELVKGIPITRFCDENRLTPRERLELFVPVCQAVQHAHQKGVIHRDLKPTNVLVTLYDGNPVPKVIDFGVAKALHQKLTERTMFTAFGTVVGTLEYMSPEQAEMNALDVDTRSDVYSLGVLLYELLTGTTPLQHERLKQAAYYEVLRLIREEEPPRPSNRLSGSGAALARISAQRKMEPAQLARLLRGELDWIVMKALEKERGRRYETALGLARDVERYLQDEPVEACPPSVAYRLGKFARKNRVMLCTAAAFVVLLVVAAGVSTGLAVVARRAESIANEQREQVADERDRADRSAKDATVNAAEARQALDRLSVEQGLRLAENEDLFTALLWFAKPLERGGLSPDQERIHRTRFACYLRHTHGRPILRQILFHDGELRQITFSSDARRLLTASEEAAHIWNLNTGDRIATLNQMKHITALQFIDEGRRVSGQMGLIPRVWNAETGKPIDSPKLDRGIMAASYPIALPLSPLQALGPIVAWEPINNSGMASSPDGSRWLHWSGTHVGLSDSSTGRVLHVWSFPRDDGPILGGQFSPDGKCVLIRTDRQVRVYNIANAKPIGPPISPGYAASWSAMSSDGQRILLADASKISVWDSGTGKLAGSSVSRKSIPLEHREGTIVYRSYGDSPPAISPDGRIVAFGAGTNVDVEAGRFTLWDIEGGLPLVVQPNQIAPVQVTFAPDGCQVLTAGKDKTAKLWDAKYGTAAGPLLPNLGYQTAYAFSPDGSMIATASGDGIVRVWHLAGDSTLQHEKPRPQANLPRAIDFPTVNLRDTWRGMRWWSNGSRLRPSQLRDLVKALPPQAGDAEVFAALSPDGRRLVTLAYDKKGDGVFGPSSGRTVGLWDVSTGQPIGQPIANSGKLTHVEFSPDSRRLVTTCLKGTLRIWDAKSGEPIGPLLRHGEQILHAAFSSDSARLVTSSIDGTAQVWDTATASPIGPRLIHAESVNRAAFSPDNQFLATASSDGTARLWDAGKARPIGRPLTHKGCVYQVAFSPKRDLVLTTETPAKFGPYASIPNGDRGFRIWDTVSQQEVSPGVALESDFGIEPEAAWDAEEGFVRREDINFTFDMRPDERPSADLVKLAQLYAGQRLDEQDGLVPLTKAEVQTLWAQLRAKYPNEFTVRPESIRLWHLGRIKILEGAGNDPKHTNTPAVQLHREWLKKLDREKP